MDALNAIHGRHSIRSYTDRPVPQDEVEQLLRAAMAAPSAGNQQAWHFVVVDDRAVLDRIPEFHPHAAMLRQAPLAVVICADLDLEKYKGYWVQDCAAATENLLLAAHALGLGAVWLGVHPVEDRVAGVRELLGLPKNVMPLSIVSVGWPDEQKGPADRYDPARVHRNAW